MDSDSRRIGPALLTYLGMHRNVPGADFDGDEGRNTAHRFRIELPTRPALIADWITWQGTRGDGDIRVQWLEGREAEGCPRAYHRLGVYPHPDDDPGSGRRVMMLRMVKAKKGKGPGGSLQMTSLEEIEEVTGVRDPRALLLEWGAERVGRRDELGWPATRKDGQLCVRFPLSSIWTPVAALVLGVVLPPHARAGVQV